MAESSCAGRARPIPLLLACTFALTACGGGSGGGSGGSGGSSLSGEQTAALAAIAAADVIGVAQSTASEQLEDDSGPSTMSSNSFVGVQNSVPCTSGTFDIQDSNTDIDIENVTFPAPFSGNLAPGLDENIQTRANNCKSSAQGFSMSVHGAADVMTRSFGLGGGEVMVLRVGGYAGDFTTPPNTDELYRSHMQTGTMAMTTNMRGELYVCEKCLDSALNKHSGSINDITVSAFMVMELDSGEEWFKLKMGRSVNEQMSMVTTDLGGGEVAMEVNGRLAMEAHNNCNFDVTYATEPGNRLVTTNFQQDANHIVEGEIKITDNKSGTDYTVSFDAQGNAYVNGNLVDTSDLDTACGSITDDA